MLVNATGDMSSNSFLGVAATGDICVSVPGPTTTIGNAARGPCTANALSGAALPGIGESRFSKFPPTTRTASVSNAHDIAFATWTSSTGSIFTFFRQARHIVSASASRGFAVAESDDPWFFPPSTTTVLNLSIEIEDLSLNISDLGFDESATAAFESVGAFGIGDTPGENIIDEWNFF